MNKLKTFSQKLLNYRKEKRVSQTKLANAICVTQQCISSYERAVNEPSLTQIWLLADYFGVSIDDLVGRNQNAQN